MSLKWSNSSSQAPIDATNAQPTKIPKRVERGTAIVLNNDVWRHIVPYLDSETLPALACATKTTRDAGALGDAGRFSLTQVTECHLVEFAKKLRDNSYLQSSFVPPIVPCLVIGALSAVLLATFNANLHAPPPSPPSTPICVVGSGLSGAVLAERFASTLHRRAVVLEKRSHIGGNCYDYIDSSTGLRVNKYGAHLFHTRHDKVWDYVQAFATWVPYRHEVTAYVDGKHVPVPVNIDTVNALFDVDLRSEAEMHEWLKNEQTPHPEPSNSEEVALSRVGKRLYEMLFKPYTIKQWAKSPAELGPEVLARIPVRSDHNPHYFPDDPYQALPLGGYTSLFQNILSHPLIEVRTDTDYFKVRSSLQCERTYFTGPIDAYFAHLGWPKLEYRSLSFERKVIRDVDYFQPKSVVNHPSPSVDYTRVVEYKHLPTAGSSPHTVLFYERSTDEGEPYYPVPNPEVSVNEDRSEEDISSFTPSRRLASLRSSLRLSLTSPSQNQALYARYQAMAANEKDVVFVGRLANYKYFNMDDAIKNSLELFDTERNK